MKGGQAMLCFCAWQNKKIPVTVYIYIYTHTHTHMLVSSETHPKTSHTQHSQQPLPAGLMAIVRKIENHEMINSGLR